MMDSFEFTKISAAVLMALLLIFLPKTLIEMGGSGHGDGHEKDNHGYKLPVAAVASPSGATAAPQPAAFDAASVVANIAGADVASGQTVFKKCLGCHSAEAGAANKVGPNLWNVLGRNKAGLDSFKGYSSAIKETASESWDYAALAGFLHKPKKYLPGTKMVFPGVKDDGDLAALIAYIRTLSDSPAALP